MTGSPLAARALSCLLLLGPMTAQSLVRDIRSSNGNAIQGEIVAAGGHAFFVADDGVHGREVWVSDGTPNGTRMVADLNVGPGSSTTGPLVPFGNGVLCTANDGITGREPYYFSVFSAYLIADLFPGPSGSNPAGFFVASNGSAYFSANEPTYGTELWTTGSGLGCSLVSDIYPGPTGSFASVTGEAAHGLVLTAMHPTWGFELWVTSGSGATLLADINPGTANGVSGSFTSSRGAGFVFFAGFQPATGIEPWCTDGTTSGTFLVQDLVPGAASSQPAHFAHLNGACLFAAQTTATGRELFRATAAPNSVSLLNELLPGTGHSNPEDLTVAGSLVFFRATLSGNSAEYFRTDGTSTGLVMLGARGATAPMYPAGIGNRVLLRARDPAAAEEGWVSDGTAAGTRRLFDLNPGPSSSSPTGFSVVGDRVLFAADDGVVGYELFAMPLSMAGAAVVEGIGQGCSGTAGTPALAGIGPPALGNASFGYRLSRAAPSAPAALFLALRPATTPLGGGCTLYVPFGGNATMSAVTDATGRCSWPLPVPMTPSLVGMNVFTQAAVLDPNGAFAGAVSFSNGVRAVVGES